MLSRHYMPMLTWHSTMGDALLGALRGATRISRRFAVISAVFGLLPHVIRSLSSCSSGQHRVRYIDWIHNHSRGHEIVGHTAHMSLLVCE